ncbi:excinuclease ABC subunit UvrC [Candidatus Peregrinibacteria bacterium]|nr:excinuclease ABC subunit UvrC [Candidatus Peregrinibacteria bacterium]
MNQKIQNILKNLPRKPGVYRFYNGENNLLYVGKAINLAHRVKSYFQKTHKLSQRIQKLVSQIEDIEYTVVGSELEALILETNLIKENRPKYNILMKDDKNYVYLKITQNEDFPRVLIVRNVLNDGALYFGPKTASGKLKKTLDVLKKIFPYRHCNLFLKYEGPGKVIVTKKTMKYPCLDFHIKRCIGPCVCACTKGEYAEMIKQIINFFKGKGDKIIESLVKPMNEAAGEKNFEKAAALRDKLHAINEILEKQIISAPTGEEMDIINYVYQLGRIYFTLFIIRDGKLIDQENFIFKMDDSGETTSEDSEILESFLNQYYENSTDIPKKIIIPHEIEGKNPFEEWLKVLKGRKVELIAAQKGDKNKLLELALKNAKIFADTSRARWQGDENKRKKALEELKNILSLSSIPKRIECYDISHISGTNQVASMAVFENGIPENKKYRRFKIRTVKEGKPDDFAAMLEVIKRRLLYLSESKSSIKIKNYAKKQMFDDFCFYNEIKPSKDIKIKELAFGIIDKAPKNRVYVSVKKNLISDFEACGFQEIKKIPGGIQLKRGEQCLLFNKKKYFEENEFRKIPDLIVFDGGKGQLSQGLKIAKEFKMNIPMISLAKKNEEVYIPEKSFPIDIPKNSEALYLLQQIRDEAHRFAIAYHQKLREKGLIQ